MNVEDRLHLSGRNLLGCLSRDDGYLPYWQMAVDEELRAMYQFRPWCTGHNVGRRSDAGQAATSAAPAYTHGRAIEGLLCFHAATGEPAALEEAERLADFHFEYLLNEDGSLAAGCGHHTHSYLNTLRGLLGLAVLQGSRRRQELICLIELWTRTVDVEEEIVRVNFHFDRKLSQVEVSAERGESTARVAVVNRTGKKLRLRLPGWADPGTCSLTVDESPVEANRGERVRSGGAERNGHDQRALLRPSRVRGGGAFAGRVRRGGGGDVPLARRRDRRRQRRALHGAVAGTVGVPAVGKSFGAGQALSEAALGWFPERQARSYSDGGSDGGLLAEEVGCGTGRACTTSVSAILSCSVCLSLSHNGQR